MKENNMEPKILMIGRAQEVIDILIEELKHYNRNVVGSNKKEAIKELLLNDTIDLVVIGAGLPDEIREEMVDFLQSIVPDLDINLIERTEKGSPYKLIEFTNQKAIEWKVGQKLGKRPEGGRK